ncbi:phage/plasmid primase, P4 family [Choristoneura biennis entomopoxvirus]|uniref:Phage/plasmid primase, P4 family n=1 Tax=Choristoneura biennis entomopoxvirus TaxID=10288 RepID=A0A916KPZ3_CBEPV|nr:DNA primase [Choristoneura biennis entomopoxvirus]YP_008004400.1 DNA primase [Choristoneura biennis entomopoxvirus]CCU55573.1 phage/plasmid primase, P4 family [Choristoneura biennis entomopoxvirus]CCU55898.1 phage/plasmid primase, P4 family [Choristoneura biennis entomopoxvirus]
MDIYNTKENLKTLLLTDKYLHFIKDEYFIFEIIPLIKKYIDDMDISSNTDSNIWINWLINDNKFRLCNETITMYYERYKRYLNNNLSPDDYKFKNLTECDLSLIINIFSDLNFDIIIYNMLKNHIHAYNNKFYKINFDENIFIKLDEDIIKEVKIILYEYKLKLLNLTKRLSEKNITEIEKHIEKVYKYKINIKEVKSFCNNKNIKFMNNFREDYLPLANKNNIDLRTGEIVSRNINDYFDFCSDLIYDKNYNDTPDFIKDITNNDKDLIELLQKILGCCITGKNKEQVFFIFYGKGSNGKSTLMSYLQKILNNMYHSINISDFNKNTFTNIDDNKILTNNRLCVLEDSRENDTLDDVKFKNITDKSKSKIILCTNFKPNFDTNTLGMTRRIVYFPFNISFVAMPENELEKLENINYNTDIDKLFSWIIKGAIKNNKDTLKKMPILYKLRNELICDVDPIAEYLNIKIEKKDNFNILSSELYNKYLLFLEEYEYEDKYKNITNMAFSNILTKKGYKKIKKPKGMFFTNISFKL